MGNAIGSSQQDIQRWAKPDKRNQEKLFAAVLNLLPLCERLGIDPRGPAEPDPPPVGRRAAQSLKDTDAFNDIMREQVNEGSGIYSPSKKDEPKTAPKVQAPHARPVRSRRAKKREQ